MLKNSIFDTMLEEIKKLDWMLADIKSDIQLLELNEAIQIFKLYEEEKNMIII